MATRLSCEVDVKGMPVEGKEWWCGCGRPGATAVECRTE